MRYLIERDAFAARLVRNRIADAVALLAERSIGRPSQMPGVSQKLVLKTPFLVIYRASDAELTVLRIIHQSRNWRLGERPED